MAPTAGDASSAQTQPLAKYAEFTHYLVTAAPGTAGQYVAHVEINRPAKLNAFFEAMWLQLGALFERLSQDPDIRAVVLSGAGDRAFTAGLDVQTASGPDSVLAGAGGDSDDPARRAAVLRRHVDEFQRCLTAVEKCEKRMNLVYLCYFCSVRLCHHANLLR